MGYLLFGGHCGENTTTRYFVRRLVVVATLQKQIGSYF